MISIIIPTFNREDKVLRAIKSIEKQKFKDYEIIVVDDGSEDKTRERIELLMQKNSRIKYFYIKNSGPGQAKNYGVEKAKFDYVTFLDSDDELYSVNTLEKIKLEIDKNNEVIGFEEIIKIGDKGERKEKLRRIKNMKKYILEYPLNYPGYPPYTIKKSIYIEVGGLNSQEKWGEALLFWRKIFLKNPNFGLINEVGYIYHLEGDDNVSKGKLIKNQNRSELVYNTIKNSYEVLNKELNNEEKSIWTMVLFLINIKRKKIKLHLFKGMGILSILSALFYVFKRRAYK